MIQPIDLQTDTVFAYRVDGQVTADILRPYITVLEEKLKQHNKMRVYVEYVAIEGISPKAIWDDLKFDVAHLTDFEKAAVVTDKDWVGVSAGLANLIPGLTVKFFKPAEQEQARQWVKS